VEYYDMPAVRAIVRDAARDNYRFSSIVMGIVKSAPFQMRKADDVTTINAERAETAEPVLSGQDSLRTLRARR